LIVLVVLTAACTRNDLKESSAASQQTSPSILLVTLDTTRADSIGPDARANVSPAFNALAARGRRFSQAYATVPETLPSHSSMMTGLYPAGHGVHENARTLAAAHPVVAERLKQAGYQTAAFVSSFVLARRFGLSRGFDLYDDELPQGLAERSSKDTTDSVLTYLQQPQTQPLFLWVHYFDPHAPYAPPSPFSETYKETPYLGEIAAMDVQLGRLVEAFERQARGPAAIIVAGDHGEGLGDHGESLHGNLLYQSTMHVPMVLIGPGVPVETVDRPVSIRKIFHTILDLAGMRAEGSLRTSWQEVVLGEAMKPFLEYGWLPQTMVVDGPLKGILAGKLESYDVINDPREKRDLGGGVSLSPVARKALEEYPVPSRAASRPPENLSDEARRNLASLGYVAATAQPVVRKDAPRPVDMVHLFEAMERASTLFVAERHAEAIPVLRKILGDDPHNLDAALRLATSYSLLGHSGEAEAAFRRASQIAPDSPDVRVYMALHFARGSEWSQAEAAPLLEKIVADEPDRLPAVEALALIRERQGRTADAIGWYQRAFALRSPRPAELVRLAQLAMSAQQTPLAIESFEKARSQQGAAFAHDLEVGVLYLAARRFPEARDALDRVPASDPGYPMALFKRAQVSVLLNEPDSQARIATARRHADAMTRPLIAQERLFQQPSR
jgi:tetratricopeptide (TPR) repeat protein